MKCSLRAGFTWLMNPLGQYCNGESMKHVQAGCFEPNTCGGGCWGCTLGVCEVCGLFEGSLTTHCPGVPSQAEWGDKVYEERWDYKDGKWLQHPEGARFQARPEFEE